jgi:hypothetical protein
MTWIGWPPLVSDISGIYLIHNVDVKYKACSFVLLLGGEGSVEHYEIGRPSDH